MTLFIIMFKEIVDNLRDRQTLFYALLFGPVLLPLLVGGSMVAGFKQMSIDFDEVQTLAVANADRAPNLVEFLRAHNIDAEPAPEDIESSVRYGRELLVLDIPEDFGTSLRIAQPAPLLLHINNANKDSVKAGRRIQTILNAYSQSINALRLQHRGIDPDTFKALVVNLNDVSDEGSDGLLLASLLPFLFIMSMVLGGYYLAIDTTAGERERQSLEPLLSLPVPRSAIVFGKYGATFCFVTLSAMLTTLSIYGLFRVFPVELMSGQITFDGTTLTRAFMLASPLLFFISALLITVSAITRSTKQAQTYLGLLMLIPMAPFFILQFINVQSTVFTSGLPLLSQYQLLESVVLGDELPLQHIALSFIGTLLCTAVLLASASAIYRRERMVQ